MKNIILSLLLCNMFVLIPHDDIDDELTDEEASFVAKKKAELDLDENDFDATFDEGVEEIIKELTQDTHVVRIAITICKGKKESRTDLWNDLIRTSVVAAVQAESSGTISSEVIQELCKHLNTITVRGYEQDINGEITISMSDGEPMDNCCGNDCRCAERYNGNCPCVLDKGDQENQKRSCCGSPVADEDDTETEDEDVVLDDAF